MDLSRWSLDLTRFKDRYRELKTFLSEVLEGERAFTEASPDEKPSNAGFEIRSDFASLKRLWENRSKDHHERTRDFFSALAPFFEAGFLVNVIETTSNRTPKMKLKMKRGSDLNASTDSSFELETMFVFGRVFHPNRNEKPRLKISLPRAEAHRVFRGDTGAVLKPFRLESSKRLRECSAFTFSPATGVHYILICSRPQIWQIEALEEVCVGAHEFILGKGTEL